MKSINYYIQLSDVTSTKIDSMNKQQLIHLAKEVLDVHSKGGAEYIATKDILMDSVEFNSLINLAHGCLTKATAMSEV